MNFAKQVFHPCDITNKTPKSFAKSEEMQHDNLKALKLKLTQEAETLPSAGCSADCTHSSIQKPTTRHVSFTPHPLHTDSTFSAIWPVFHWIYAAVFLWPLVRKLPLVTLLTTSGGGEAGDVKISLKREVTLQVVNYIARVKWIKFDLYFKQVYLLLVNLQGS